GRTRPPHFAGERESKPAIETSSDADVRFSDLPGWTVDRRLGLGCSPRWAGVGVAGGQSADPAGDAPGSLWERTGSLLRPEHELLHHRFVFAAHAHERARHLARD